ncbi:putative ubiquitin thioesterase OTUB1 [Apostichopus japonicus]|uniref:Ubiquitin thioesterase n=1 Tax=Stichopus japonicus TaxID=307972 RepID=A0A2G8JLP1_STIJA|nr:putative ubiquitin thioesterase OTUB1 [Apostichopus japonicus]PIK42816.1 putative ubiquitin thioesterase OTUB1 [Apostichopus japonicus]
MAENPDNKIDEEIERLTGMVRDEAILAQQDRIQKEVEDSNALVSERLPLLILKEEYQSDPIYSKKIEDMNASFPYIRKTRGDGNCFFRAFGFAYMEKLLSDKAELHRFKEIIEKSKDTLISLGCPSFTLMDFHDTFMEVVNQLEEKPSLSELVATYCDQGMSDYLVVYLRLLTSLELQKEAEFYQNFVEGNRTVKEFCSQEVEPMYKESDHIHIIALTSYLGVGVRVVYLDRGENQKVNHHDFPEGMPPQIALLYRPGHYDVLYGD